MTKTEIANEIMKHAVKNYENDGWDFVVECKTVADIEEMIGDRDLEAALAFVKKIVGILDERRRDAEAEAF